MSGVKQLEFSSDHYLRGTRVQTPKGATIALFFGTFSGDAYAVDAVTGAEIWRTDIKDHPNAVTGTPIF